MRILNKHILYALLALSALTLGACSSDDTVELTPEFTLTTDGVDANELLFNSIESYRMLALQSNMQWSVTSDKEWCKLSNSSGDATYTDYQTVHLKVTAEVNTDDSERTATITLQVGDKTKTVQIRQYGASSLDPLGWETAAVAVSNIKIGWNLGNTLDSNGTWITSEDPKDTETAWGNPVTTPELIQAIKDGGFNAVRVPVTWWQHMDDNWMVKEAWMNRVEEVVNYVLDAGMYCILNVHHDTGQSDVAWLKADLDNYEEINTKFASLWTQVAERFNSYDEKLLFAGYNEMLDKNQSWTSTDESGYKALNQLAQVFVTTVRATGGNNVARNLIVNTYSSDPGEKTVSNFILPTDQYPNHLITEVHVYAPGNFTNIGGEDDTSVWTADGERELDEIMTRLNDYFVSKGIPVIIGEFGAHDKDNESEQAKYASYFVKAAKQHNIASFWWFDLIDRTTYQWTFPQVKDAIINAWQ